MRPSIHPAWPAVAGWLTPGEADALYRHAASLASGDQIVEIGSWVGRSAIALGLGAQVSGARVATIDYGADPSHDALLRENLARCGVADTVTVYRARSETVAETWTADVQLLFIDGWHDAEHIQRDLDAWLPHSADGGLLLFHDAHGAGWPDVDAAVDRLCDVGWASTRWELLGYDGTIAILRRTR